MKSVDCSLGLLGAWSTNRHPSAANSRHIIGSWAAKSALQYFAVEYLVHLSWDHYDYFHDVISDLGARTKCGAAMCWSFVVMDLSLMALGTAAMVAASLITSPVLRVGGLHPKFLDEGKRVQKGLEKKRMRLTALVRLSLGLTGLALFGVGAFPDDYLEVPHRICTLAVIIGSVATLGMLWWLWRKPRPKTARGLLALAVVSIVGAVGFIVSSYVPGLFERLAVYGFIAGIFTMGIALTNGAHQPSADELVPGMDTRGDERGAGFRAQVRKSS